MDTQNHSPNYDYETAIEMFLQRLQHGIAESDPQDEHEIEAAFHEEKHKLLDQYPELRLCYACHGFDAGIHAHPPEGHNTSRSYWGRRLAARMYQLARDLKAALPDPPLALNAEVVQPEMPDFDTEVIAPEVAAPTRLDYFRGLIPDLRRVKPGGLLRVYLPNREIVKKLQEACGNGLLDLVGWHEGVPPHQRRYETRSKPQDGGGFRLDVRYLPEPVARIKRNRKKKGE